MLSFLKTEVAPSPDFEAATCATRALNPKKKAWLSYSKTLRVSTPVLVVALALCLLAGVSYAAAPEWIRADWGTHPSWDDGLAEVNVFDATTTLHGEPRPYEFVAIFSATQILGSGAEVSENTPGAAGTAQPALKMTIVSDRIETGEHPYDLASTVLADRANPLQVFSSVATSHDWQGVTAKRYVSSAGKATFEAWSTAHPGHLQRVIPDGVVPLEAVPLFLRAMDWSTTATFRCLPTLMAHRIPWSSQVPEPPALNLSAAVDATETTTTAAGTFECYRVRVSTTDGRVPMTVWYEKAFPHRLIYKTTASGKIFSLRKSERRKLMPSDPR